MNLVLNTGSQLAAADAQVFPAPLGATGHVASNEPAETRRWYAVSVIPRHEKHVAHFLEALRINYLLPVYSSMRRWKDRQKQIDMVLFPGYVFVNIALEDRVRVLKVSGVSQFISFQGRPAAIADHEIQAIGASVNSGVVVQPHPYLKKGRRVRVRNGPMAGVEGILVRKKDKFRVVLSIDLIMSSVAAELSELDVEPMD